MVGLVEVAHASCNPSNEPFVLASQVTQVYYIPYACKSDMSLNAWWVAYKVKPLGSLPIPLMDDYNTEDPPYVDVFQEDGIVGEFVVDIGEGLDNITISGSDEVVDPRELSMLNNPHNVVSGENELLVEEESENDTESCPEINNEPCQEDIEDF